MSRGKKTRFWRTLGKAANTGLGATLYQTGGGTVNKLMGLTQTPDLTADIPWTPLDKPLAECTVTLISTAGVHCDDDEPFDVDALEGDPTYRVVPADTPLDRLSVTHTHYPHRFLDADLNVVWPADRLRELAEDGVLRLARRFYGFGFAGTLTRAFVDEPDGTAHRLAAQAQEDGCDIALVAPA